MNKITEILIENFSIGRQRFKLNKLYQEQLVNHTIDHKLSI